jgi:hypothetical protein
MSVALSKALRLAKRILGLFGQAVEIHGALSLSVA